MTTTWADVEAAIDWLEANAEEEFRRSNPNLEEGETVVPYVFRILDLEEEGWNAHTEALLLEALYKHLPPIVFMIGGPVIATAFTWGIQIGLAIDKAKGKER